MYGLARNVCEQVLKLLLVFMRLEDGMSSPKQVSSNDFFAALDTK